MYFHEGEVHKELDTWVWECIVICRMDLWHVLDNKMSGKYYCFPGKDYLFIQGWKSETQNYTPTLSWITKYVEKAAVL